MSIVEHPWFLSLDSFLACVALSALGPSQRERYHLAVAFGLCDGLASLLSEMHYAKLLVLPILAACVFWGPRMGASAGRRGSWLLALPLGLSIDNLLDPVPPAAALACGIVSATWALVGLQLGRVRVTRLLGVPMDALRIAPLSEQRTAHRKPDHR